MQWKHDTTLPTARGQREAPHYAAFEKRMAELGYQQGQNFIFEYIQAPSIEGYEITYRELAARKVDIMLAAGNKPALRAARGPAGYDSAGPAR
jgi:putative tryptophan/tyrosine transport system substrate-binding protein